MKKRLSPQVVPRDASGLGTNEHGAGARFLSFLGGRPERRECYHQIVERLHRDVEQQVTR